MSRVELGRDRLVRRPDMQSPAGAATGTFREAIGMNENGPVIPQPSYRGYDLDAIYICAYIGRYLMYICPYRAISIRCLHLHIQACRCTHI